MTERQRIIDRIRKCLRLSDSPESHEAAAALRQAQALMAKHGISQDEVRLADVREAKARPHRSQRPPAYLMNLAQVVARAFGVEIYIERSLGQSGRFVFCGVQPSEEIARYAFDVLRRKLESARRGFYRRTRGKRQNRIARADTYALAWVYGVEQNVTAFAQGVPAIVGQYMCERHPGLVKTSARNRARATHHKEAAQGLRDGMSVELRHGMNAGQPQHRIGGDS